MQLLDSAAAGKALGLGPGRIRALIASGHLKGEKHAGRWFVDAESVAWRARAGAQRGRSFAAHNAWALLFLASGREASWISPGVRWRLVRSLAWEGLSALAPRLGHRAEVRYLRAHPGQLAHLREDARLVLSGASAAGAHGLGLALGEELDAYLPASELENAVSAHGLQETLPVEANVLLRVIPMAAWHFEKGERLAPLAAVALDLAESPDSRSMRIGRDVLERLSGSSGAAAKSG